MSSYPRQWIRISTSQGPINVVSIYAPSGVGARAKRKALGNWLRSRVSQGNWILCGDHTMVNYPDDWAGSSAVLDGNEGWMRLIWLRVTCVQHSERGPNSTV